MVRDFVGGGAPGRVVSYTYWFVAQRADIEADFAEKKLAAEEAYSEAKIKITAKRDDDLQKAAQDNEKKIKEKRKERKKISLEDLKKDWLKEGAVERAC